MIFRDFEFLYEMFLQENFEFLKLKLKLDF